MHGLRYKKNRCGSEYLTRRCIPPRCCGLQARYLFSSPSLGQFSHVIARAKHRLRAARFINLNFKCEKFSGSTRLVSEKYRVAVLKEVWGGVGFWRWRNISFYKKCKLSAKVKVSQIHVSSYSNRKIIKNVDN